MSSTSFSSSSSSSSSPDSVDIANKNKALQTNSRLIPYLPLDVREPKGVVDKIRSRRGPTGLLNLDRVLLHVPALAEGWNSFFGAIRNKVALAGQPKELAICLIAILNKAPYEFDQHAPVYLEEGGDQMKLDHLYILERSLRREDEDEDEDRGVNNNIDVRNSATAHDSDIISSPPLSLLRIKSYLDIENCLKTQNTSFIIETYTELELLLLFLTIEMTVFARSPTSLLIKIKEHLNDDKQLIELIMVISGYNCCSRFLVAMNITGPDGIP